MNKIYIFGHRNPDTDSVTASIALSYLKNKQGANSEARVLGTINKETKYALDYFNITEPKLLDDVKVQIEDINYRKDLMINENASIYEAYTYMVDNGITGLPIVHDDNKFYGYVSLKEIATDFIKGDFDFLNASYENILKVISAEEITRFEESITGQILAATFSSEMFISDVNLDEDSIVIVGDRKHVIDYCINKKVKLIILVGNQSLSNAELEKAKENKVSIIRTKKRTFEVAKLIGLSNYIRTIVRNETPVVFNPKDYLTDFLEVSNKLKHTNYPIVDKKGKCLGLLRLLDLNSYQKKEVILVDHNELKQSVTGLNEASILEIVDHHALGTLTTNNPISFRSMTVGSTNTVIYDLYKEAGVEIPKDIAGIMLAGLLSDTLILKSPTTTDKDICVAKELSLLAGVNYEEFGINMIKAGSSLEGMSIEDVVFSDYKEYSVNDMGFGIGQVLTLDYQKILDNKEEYIEFLDKTCKLKGFKLLALYITDVINNGSYVLYSSNASKIMSLAYDKENLKQGEYLEGVISRKKQMQPNIMIELENMD